MYQPNASHEQFSEEYIRDNDVHGLLEAGTESLLQDAVDATSVVVRDDDSGNNFVQTYAAVQKLKETGETEDPLEGLGLFPPTIEPTRRAVDAIDRLKAARLQNIVSDPYLSAVISKDPEVAATSPFVKGLEVSVAMAAIKSRDQERAGRRNGAAGFMARVFSRRR